MADAERNIDSRRFPERTFKIWVPNKDLTGQLPVLVTLQGDLDGAQSLLFSGVQHLKQLRLENVQDLPQYWRSVALDNGSVIFCRTQFGMEDIVIHVPPVTAPQEKFVEIILKRSVLYIVYLLFAGDGYTLTGEYINGEYVDPTSWGIHPKIDLYDTPPIDEDSLKPEAVKIVPDKLEYIEDGLEWVLWFKVVRGWYGSVPGSIIPEQWNTYFHFYYITKIRVRETGEVLFEGTLEYYNYAAGAAELQPWFPPDEWDPNGPNILVGAEGIGGSPGTPPVPPYFLDDYGEQFYLLLSMARSDPDFDPHPTYAQAYDPETGAALCLYRKVDYEAGPDPVSTLWLFTDCLRVCLEDPATHETASRDEFGDAVLDWDAFESKIYIEGGSRYYLYSYRLEDGITGETLYYQYGIVVADGSGQFQDHFTYRFSEIDPYDSHTIDIDDGATRYGRGLFALCREYAEERFREKQE